MRGAHSYSRRLRFSGSGSAADVGRV